MSEYVRVLSAVGASRDIYLPTTYLLGGGLGDQLHIDRRAEYDQELAAIWDHAKGQPPAASPGDERHAKHGRELGEQAIRAKVASVDVVGTKGVAGYDARPGGKAPAANPEQRFIRTGYSEQQEGSTAVLMAEGALGDAQGRHAITRTPRARIGQLSRWSLGAGLTQLRAHVATEADRLREELKLQG